jgi:F-type H+-transporting ATPase subunit delta
MVQIIQSYVQLSAKDRGEASAEVASASPLSHDQLTELTRHLEHSMGKKVVVTSRIDPSLLGGLVVKVGSRMIDNSLSSKLERMKLVMKGIG